MPGAVLTPGEFVVPRSAARHARVARVREGESIEILDLDGGVGVGRVTAWRRDQCVVVLERVEWERGEPPAALVLALGVTQGQAFDWAVEKATELGVTAVQPVVSERVQRGDLSARVPRWRRVAEAAVAQCGRTRPPAISSPLLLGDVVRQAVGRRLLADPEPPATAAGEGSEGQTGATVLVGPEGGFDQVERSLALASGFEPLYLGPRVLRTETAAVSALVLAQRRLGWLE